MTEGPIEPNSDSPVQARPISFSDQPLSSGDWPPTPPPSKLTVLSLPQLTFREAALDLMLIGVAAILLPYFPLLFALITPSLELESEVSPIVIIQTWCQALLALGLLTYMICRHRLPIAGFGLRHDGYFIQSLWSLVTLICVYAAMYVAAIVVTMITLVTPGAEEDLMHRIDFARQMPIDNLGETLVLLIAVALNEEIIFRGLLIPYLRRLTGNWFWAALLSTLLFASLHIPHQGVLAALQIFAVGAILSLFFLLSRSLLVVIVAHFLFDFLQFQLIRSPFIQKLMEDLPTN